VSASSWFLRCETKTLFGGPLPHSPVSTTRFVHRGLLFLKPSFTAAAVRKHVGLVGHGQDKEVHHQPPAVSEAVCKQSSAPKCQLSPLRPNASSALCHSALAAARQPAAAMRLLRLLGTRWQAAASQLGRCSNRARDRMEWFPMLTRARARPCRFAQVVEVIHPGLAGVSKKDLKEKLATMYKVRATPSRLWPVARRQQRQQRREQHQPELAVALGGSSCIA